VVSGSCRVETTARNMSCTWTAVPQSTVPVAKLEHIVYALDYPFTVGLDSVVRLLSVPLEVVIYAVPFSFVCFVCLIQSGYSR
jgi:hypothetical protein